MQPTSLVEVAAANQPLIDIDGTVIIQFVLFVVMFFAANKLLFQPYLKLRAKRIAGFHTWTDAEIAAYRSRHALGTTPRLALELMLWTMLRVGDAAAFKPGQDAL